MRNFKYLDKANVPVDMRESDEAGFSKLITYIDWIYESSFASKTYFLRIVFCYVIMGVHMVKVINDYSYISRITSRSLQY
jgi:hypothetical protein